MSFEKGLRMSISREFLPRKFNDILKIRVLTDDLSTIEN